MQIKNAANVTLTDQSFTTLAIGANSSVNENRSMSLVGASAGTYYAYVIVDSQSQVTQSNTSNDGQNNAGTPFMVQSAVTPADLVPQSISVSPNPAMAGGSVTVNYTVANTGGTAAPASHTKVQIKNASAVLLTEQTFLTSAVGANSSVNESRSMSLVGASVGTYYAYVIVDNTASEVTQSNYANDLSSGTAFDVQTGSIDAPVSDGFDYPIGAKIKYSHANDGDGWKVDNEFNELYNGKYHLGEDWNAETGGSTDYGSPLFAAANGTIIFAGQATVSGWGKVILIRHKLPDGSFVETLYGHVASILKTSGDVTRGEQVGTIGDGDGIYPNAAHLHFEVRLSTCPDWGREGTGYSATPSPAGWTAPSAFLDAHRPVSGPAPSISSVNPNPVTGSASQQTITIYGANFVNKPTLTLTWTVSPLPPAGGYTVPAAQVTFVSSTEVRMAINTTTDPDNWTVKVTNPDGQQSNVKSFQVGAPPASATARRTFDRSSSKAWREPSAKVR